MSCGCNGHSSRCGCQSVARSGISPFYASCCECQEEHSEHVIEPRYATAITTGNDFNMPACGGATAVISLPGICTFQVGTYLWNPTYGYLHVVGVDIQNESIYVENPCLDVNAAPGTTVPSCTFFIITDPPYTGAGVGGPASIYPFLAVDFIAPANGDCIDVAVTNANGLQTGHVVSLAGGVYNLTNILSNTLIRICNAGGGVTPGTTVHALDGVGNYIQPIIMTDTNPCNETSSLSGTLLVCNSGIVKPITGSVVGQIPVLTDVGDGTVEFQSVPVETLECTLLRLCLNMTSGVQGDLSGAGRLLMVVDDTSIFDEYDLLQVTGCPLLARILEIISPTQLYFRWSGVPSSTVSYPAGTAVCQIPCCQIVNNDVYGYQYRVIGANTAAAIDRRVGHEQALCAMPTEIFIQNSGSKRIHVAIHMESHLQGTIACANVTDWIHIYHGICFLYDIDVFGATLPIVIAPGDIEKIVSDISPLPKVGDFYWADTVNFCRVFELDPGDEIRANCAAYAKILDAAADANVLTFSDFRASQCVQVFSL